VVLYLSHFIEEVKAIADRFVVLRDGKNVGGGDVSSTSIDAMVELMAGRAVGTLYPRSKRTAGDAVLSFELPTSVKLEVRRGEVVGIAGLLGAGRTELLRAIFGLDPSNGTVEVKGVVGWRAPHVRLAQGVAMSSEDRKAEGLATSLSIATNITLSRPGHWLVSRAAEERAAEPWIAKLGIRATSASQRVAELSGGNQQKVALARLLHHGADVLLVDEPTRGIDVEAKTQVYDLIDRAASEGKAVLVVSSYLPELLGICDRIHVMRRGSLGPSHDARGASEHALLREAAVG
jgi:ribose transport system ATP-binding protein